MHHMLFQSRQGPDDLLVVTGAVIVLLALVSAGYLILRWRRPSQNLPKVGYRIRFLWALTVAFVLAMVYSYKILLVYIAFIAFLGLKEFLSITPTRRADRRVLFWAYLAIPMQFFLIWMAWYEAFVVFVPIHVFVVLPIVMVIIGETRGFLRAWSMLGWGILTTVFSLGFLAFLLVLPAEGNPPSGGGGLFLFLVGMAQIDHAAQYYFGKRFAHPALSLKVSTTRNWASLVGSILLSAPLAWLVGPRLTPFTPWESVAVGAIIATGSFVGYIILSAIKGDLQLKDRGSMAPGRGGVLNRIDTFVYTAPLYFYLLWFWHY